MKKQFIYPAFALLLLALLSCGQHREESASSLKENKKMDADSLLKYTTAYNNGSEIFKHQCAGCHAHSDSPGEPEMLEKLAPDSLQWYLSYIKDSRPFKGKESTESKKFLALFPSNYAHVFRDSLSEVQLNNLVFYIIAER